MARRLRRIRQLIPTKFATAYREGVNGRPSDGTPTFASWWMWGGRCFNVKRRAI
jgi:hypothetical protein